MARQAEPRPYPSVVGRRWHQLILAVVAVALVAASCGRGGDEDDAGLARPPASTTVPPTSTSATLPVLTTSVPTTIAPPTAPPSAQALLLAPDGLGAVRFDDAADVVVDRLIAILGPPTDDSPLESCPSEGADRLVQFAELAVAIGGRRFVAWDIGPTSGALPAPLVTAEGIGVGSTQSELRSAYGDRLRLTPDDPFGPSFEVEVPAPGRLGGTLTGTSATDTVSTLRAGDTNCGE